MAKSSTRRVTIFINGTVVAASVKQIRAEMNRLVNEQNRTPNVIFAMRNVELNL